MGSSLICKGKIHVSNAVRAIVKTYLEGDRFDGCLELDVYHEEGTNTFTIVEDWASFEHYDKYLAWRTESGMGEALEGVLEGGFPAGFKVQKFIAHEDL